MASSLCKKLLDLRARNTSLQARVADFFDFYLKNQKNPIYLIKINGYGFKYKNLINWNFVLKNYLILLSFIILGIISAIKTWYFNYDCLNNQEKKIMVLPKIQRILFSDFNDFLKSP